MTADIADTDANTVSEASRFTPRYPVFDVDTFQSPPPNPPPKRKIVGVAELSNKMRKSSRWTNKIENRRGSQWNRQSRFKILSENHILSLQYLYYSVETCVNAMTASIRYCLQNVLSTILK